MITCKKRLLLALSFTIFHLSSGVAQSVKGTVVDNVTGEAFAGARITLAGTRIVAMTEDDGTFTLNTDNLGGVLSVEAPGYDGQMVPLQGRSSVVIRMLPAHPTAEPLYGANSMSAHTSVASTVMTEGLTSIDTDIAMRLSGALRTVGQSGIDAAALTMLMRGLTSVNMSARPLIVVDGVVWQSQEGVSSLIEGYFSNPLALLAPDDIERIEIVQNGAAIWGAKAAAGVINITTKRSHNMATEIAVNLSAGIRQQGKAMPMLGARDYRILASDLVGGIPQGDPLYGRQFRFLDDDTSTSYYMANHNDTDWQDETGRTATTQNYGISVRGGDDVALYAFSLGYARNEGNVRGTDFDRLNVRFNSDIDLTKQLKTRADIAFSQVTRNLLDDGIFSATSARRMAYVKSPLYNAHQFDTSGRLFGRLSDVDETGVGNPLAVTDNADGQVKNYRFTAAVAPTYTFGERLSLSALAAFSWDKVKESTFMPDFGLPSVQLYNEQGDWYGQGDNSVGSLMTRHSQLTLDLHADWKVLDRQPSVLSLKGGYRYINNAFSSDYGFGYNTGSDNLKSLSVTNSSLRTTDGTTDDWRTMTWYAVADYSLLSRYFLSISASLDSNSRFGRSADGAVKLGGVRWGLFPSATAAWVVTNEPFMSRAKGIDYLRLHAGYELTGNDDLPADATRTYFQSVGQAGLAKGLVLANIGNDRLKWEQTGTLSAGLDMNLLNNRLALSFAYFLSNTDDLLVRKQLSREYGLDSYWANDGKLSNQGFEASVRGRIVDTKDWTLLAGLSIGHYKNKVKHLADGDFTTDVLGATVLTSEGSPLGLFYGYRTAGVFSRQADADQAALVMVDETGHSTMFGAGDVRFLDLHKDGIIDSKDMTVIGDPNPDIYGNFNFSLAWRRFTLDALFTYSLGNDAYNALRRQLESGSTLSNQTRSMLRRWTADGQTTDVPRATYGDPMQNSRFSDRWIEDASYLKLRHLSLSYQVPVKPRFVQGLQLWASVSNVFTLTNYLGCDPEFSYGAQLLCQGIDAGLLPQSRAYNIGIKLNL